jgi:hypothetical protein
MMDQILSENIIILGNSFGNILFSHFPCKDFKAKAMIFGEKNDGRSSWKIQALFLLSPQWIPRVRK